MGLLEASHVDAPRGRAAAGKDHRREQKKTQSKPKHDYGINGSIRAGHEKKILTASDGRYKGTAVNSRGQKAKQVSRWGRAVRTICSVTL